jgi:glycosyltransferase involved in cell wall biosynthesis
MKMVAVSHYPPLGGGSPKSCGLIFDALAARGHRVHVIAAISAATADYDARLQPSRPATLTVSRYEVPSFNNQQFDTRTFPAFQALERSGIERLLPPLLDAFQPDLVVCGHETLAEAVFGVVRDLDVPVALLLRGSPTWQIVEGRYPPDRARAYVDLYRRADAVIPVGRYMQAPLEALGVERVRHIPNLIDLGAFAPAPRDHAWLAAHGIPPGRPLVLHASLLQSRKRGEDIARAMPLTLQYVPDAMFAFVGGEGDRGPALRALAGELGTARAIRIIPEVPYTLMPALINAADVVVSASEGEGMSRLYLEAQACGRVLVASDIPPAREVVTHGVTGLLFRMGDPADLARQIVAALSDRALSRRIGANARVRVEPHGIDAVVRQYVELFESLRAGRGRDRAAAVQTEGRT